MSEKIALFKCPKCGQLYKKSMDEFMQYAGGYYAVCEKCGEAFPIQNYVKMISSDEEDTESIWLSSNRIVKEKPCLDANAKPSGESAKTALEDLPGYKDLVSDEQDYYFTSRCSSIRTFIHIIFFIVYILWIIGLFLSVFTIVGIPAMIISLPFIILTHWMLCNVFHFMSCLHKNVFAIKKLLEIQFTNNMHGA